MIPTDTIKKSKLVCNITLKYLLFHNNSNSILPRFSYLNVCFQCRCAEGRVRMAFDGIQQTSTLRLSAIKAVENIRIPKSKDAHSCCCEDTT